MEEVSFEAVGAAIHEFLDPHLQEDLISADAVKDIRVDMTRVEVDVELGYPADLYKDYLEQELKGQIIEHVDGVDEVVVNVSWKVSQGPLKRNIERIPDVSNIIAVVSGKGGVGKSAATVNMACALQRDGASVGILDADLCGPSIPAMTGLSGKPRMLDGKRFIPHELNGIDVMSVGFLVAEDMPMMRRGERLTKTLIQLLQDTEWASLDYLLIDMPSGIGDVALTTIESIPVNGVAIVTTPQEIALKDVRRTIRMYQTADIPVLGVIENFSVYICPHCGTHDYVYGDGGARHLAEEFGISLLGSLPLDIRIRKFLDQGKPPILEMTEDHIGRAYQETARNLAARLSRVPTY